VQSCATIIGGIAEGTAVYDTLRKAAENSAKTPSSIMSPLL
jgi:hypothetical protein